MAFKLPKKSELSNIQSRIIEDSKNKKISAIVGGPGTGKTIIAIQALNDHIQRKLSSVENDKKLSLDDIGVKVVVYSHTLKDFLVKNLFKDERILIDGQKDELASTFDSWLYKFIMKKIANNNDISSYLVESKEKHKPWNYSKVMNDIKNNNLLNHYEYFFIDEAQDLSNEAIKIISLVSKKVFVTFDDAQKIGNQNEDSNSSKNEFYRSEILNILNVGEDYYDLIDNYRNTIQIENVVRLFWKNYENNSITLPQNTSKRNGPKPRIIKTISDQSFIEYVVDEYLRDPSLSIAIVVNLTHPLSNATNKSKFDIILSYLELEASKKGIDTSKIIYKFGKKKNINSENVDNSGIFVLTNISVKGLEFDNVYITNIDNYEVVDDFQKNSLYVALTRAKHKLGLVYKNEVSEKNRLINIAFDNSSLFEFIDLSLIKNDSDKELIKFFERK